MHRFELWAPEVDKVSVSVDGTLHEMQGPDAQGWWHAEVNAVTGMEYGYKIGDEDKLYPDPRSPRQVHGVHGLSQVYEHEAFRWTDEGFQAPDLATGIVYELHIGTFTSEGTFDAAIEKLGYLRDLGITHIELMPVASFPGNHGWGYDGVALYAVYEPYGGPDALKHFIDAAHRAGMAVLLDVVYNHFGPVGNYTGKFGPYLITTHKTPWGGAVNLEGPWSHVVRRFFCDNALMWMRDYHFDGLRLDAIHAFIDRSAIHFLEQLSMEVERLSSDLDRKLVLIAESDLNDPRTVTPRQNDGLGMDAQWSDDFHHALFTVLTPMSELGYYGDFGTMANLAKVLRDVFVYDGVYSGYRNRIHGKPAGDLPRNRFLGFIQNHDQVGNRAIGDRLAQVVGLNRARIAASLVLTAPFVPMLFQGEEWAASSPFQYFADHDDPEMARAVSTGRKSEFAAFGWDPSQVPDPEKLETFERCKLRWDERQQGDHAAMLEWHRKLIALRRQTADLNDASAGQTKVSFSEEQKWLRVDRGSITVLCNLGPAEQRFTVGKGARLLLSSPPETALQADDALVAADGVAILTTEATGKA